MCVDDRITLKVLRHGAGTAWVVDEAKALTARFGKLIVDSTGPAKTLIPALEQAQVPIELADTDNVCDAAALMLDGSNEGRIEVVGSPEIDDAVGVVQWRTVGERRAFGRKVGDITSLESCSLAARAAVHRKTYNVLDSVL